MTKDRVTKSAHHNHGRGLSKLSDKIMQLYCDGLTHEEIRVMLSIDSTRLHVIEDRISDCYKLYSMEECAEAWKAETAAANMVR